MGHPAAATIQHFPTISQTVCSWIYESSEMARKYGICFVAVIVVCCLIAAGCGSGRSSSATATSASPGTGTSVSAPTTPTTPSAPINSTLTPAVSSLVIYVYEDTTQNWSTYSGLIEAFTLNINSGALTPIPGSPFSTNLAAGSDMALSPNGGFAYILAPNYPVGSSPGVGSNLLVYALDPASGAPTLKQALAITSPVNGGVGPSVISVHPSGHFIYLSPYRDNSSNTGIGVFSVQVDGTVVFSSFTHVQTFGGAVISPNGAFLYSDSGSVAIGNWPATQAGCGPVSESLSAFSINSTTGALTAVAGSPFTFQRQVCEMGNAPQWLTYQIDPASERLFAVDAPDSVVDVFAIDPSSGALTQLPGTSTEPSIGEFLSSAMDPLGRFLYVGAASSFFTGFSLAANTASGTLPLLPGMPVQASNPPNLSLGSNTMAIDSSGTFLFSNDSVCVTEYFCGGADSLVEFQIDPATGVLTQLPATPITLVGTASRIVVATPQ